MTHAIQLTLRGAGAIGVILVSGPEAREILQKVCGSAKVTSLAVGQMARVNVRGGDGAVLDEALVVGVGGDGGGRFELHVHGGVAVVEAVLEELTRQGAMRMEVEEAGGLLGADHELLLALPRTTTRTGLELLLAQQAAWGNWAGRWRVFLDVPEEGRSLWPLHAAAQWVLARSAALNRLLHPARVAIVGPPNAGKSTLANALLGRPVSITSSQAGTTRDWVDVQAVFASGAGSGAVLAPVMLVDTAGIRATPDPLEQASIARSHDQAAAAQVIVLLVDACATPDPRDLALLDSLAHRRVVLAANKCDALAGPLPEVWAERGALAISARRGENLDRLMGAVLAQLGLNAVGAEPFAFNARRGELLERLAQCDDAGACRGMLEELAMDEGISPEAAGN